MSPNTLPPLRHPDDRPAHDLRLVVFMRHTDVDPDPDVSVRLITQLWRYDYAPFVDAEHAKDPAWLVAAYAHTDHRCLRFDGHHEVELFPVEDAVGRVPDLVLSFATGVHLTDCMWTVIGRYFAALLSDPVPGPRAILTRPLYNLVAPDLPAEPLPVPSVMDDPPTYTLRQMHVPLCDAMVYEIHRRGSPPFTCITYDYSHRGDLPLFTDLFISRAWGLPSDIAYLETLWNVLRPAEGDFHIGQLLKDAVERCLPSTDGTCPAAEPRVYRKPLDDVLARVFPGQAFHAHLLPEDATPARDDAQHSADMTALTAVTNQPAWDDGETEGSQLLFMRSGHPCKPSSLTSREDSRPWHVRPENSR